MIILPVICPWKAVNGRTEPDVARQHDHHNLSGDATELTWLERPLRRTVVRMVDELASLSERQGWTADEIVAIYQPDPGGWSARVRWVQVAGHTYYRFHICVLDPNGHAAYTCFATMLSEAWRVAEGNVRGRNLTT